MNRGRFALLLLLLCAAAFALRAAHLASVLRSPIGGTLVRDARFYDREAVRILDGRSAAAGVSFMNLGYPYALAAVYSVTSRTPTAALLVQAVLGALTSALVALSTRRLVRSDAAALLAGALYAAYAGAVFYDGLLLTPSFTNFCVAVTLYAIAAYLDTGRLPLLLPAGASLGLAILLRANAALWVPGLLLLVFGVRRGIARLSAPAALLCVVLVFPLPVVLYNGLARGEWAPVSANGGMNFWVGNNRNAEGVYYAADFLASQSARGEQSGFLSEARRRTGNYGMTLADASTFWLREGLSEIRRDPWRWMRIEARKLAIFWNHDEPKTNVGMEFIEGFSPVLALLPVSFPLIATLGLGGLGYLYAGRRRAEASLLLCFIAPPLATCLLFFVSGEYRHPASLALCIGAALLVEALVRHVSARLGARVAVTGPTPVRLAPLSTGVLLAGLAVPLVFWRFPALEWSRNPQLDCANYARHIADAKPDGVHAAPENVRRALELLERSRGSTGDVIRLDAKLWIETWGAVELRDRALARSAVSTAKAILAKGFRPDPEHSSDYLTRVPQYMGELLEQDFIRTDPEINREAQLLGGRGYSEFDQRFAQGDYQGAIAFLEAALARSPDHVGLEAAMGRALLALGRETEALEWLRRSCLGWPKTVDCASIAAEYFAGKGDTARAIEAAREALARDPTYAPPRELLEKLRVTR